jgi:hypothetical protein
MSDDTSRVKTTDLLREIVKADPNWNADKRREVEYEFSNGRRFVADPARRGPYADSD